MLPITLFCIAVLLLAGSGAAQLVWSQRQLAFGPPGTEAPTLVFDQARKELVLFGGKHNSGFGMRGDTWTWDGHSWTMHTLAISPSPRWWHGAAYDARRGRVVLFGGEDATQTRLGDTWEWDGIHWTERTPAVMWVSPTV